MELMNGLPIQEVRMEERVTYHCNCCGDCCRQVKDAVMLDSIDLYNLAKHFNKSVMDVLNRYADVMPLNEDGYPIFLLNTTGADDACIFLKNNRCTVQAAKPRTCRLYPFTAGPGEKSDTLQFYLCLEKQQHFHNGEIHVGNWLQKHFSAEDRLFMESEYAFIPQLSVVFHALSPEMREHARTYLMFFRYFNYDRKRPFMPQYNQNNRELMQVLGRLAMQSEEEIT